MSMPEDELPPLPSNGKELLITPEIQVRPSLSLGTPAPQPYRPGELLTRAQPILFDQRPCHTHVLGNRKEIQLRPAKHCK